MTQIQTSHFPGSATPAEIRAWLAETPALEHTVLSALRLTDFEGRRKQKDELELGQRAAFHLLEATALQHGCAPSETLDADLAETLSALSHESSPPELHDLTWKEISDWSAARHGSQTVLTGMDDQRRVRTTVLAFLGVNLALSPEGMYRPRQPQGTAPVSQPGSLPPGRAHP